jgi:hypothetical protein
MCILKGFMTLFSSLLTLLIAILAVVIAYRQYKIQEYRVRLDLYEPRMKIYDSIMKFLSAIMQKGTATNDELFTFVRETSRAKFLFKGEMEKHIDSIYKVAVDLQYVQGQLDNQNLPVGPHRTAFAEKSTEYFQWLRKQYDKTDEMLTKYVKLDK